MTHGRSGTPTFRPSGTAFSDDWEPIGVDRAVFSEAYSSPNRPNQESSGFLLTPSCCGQSAAECGRLGRTACAGAATSNASASGATDDPLTHVTLFWPHGRCEHWLRFGKPVATSRGERGRRVESYAPGQIFALVRWAGHDHGTALSHLAIVRALPRGTAVSRLASVDPGGEILLAVQGWRRVARVFAVIAAIEALGVAPEEVAADHWRLIHHRLAARRTARINDPRCQVAWLARRERQA